MRKHFLYFFSLLACLVFAGGALATTSVLVEAETYMSHGWNDNGGDPVQLGFCESASEEWCADGVDKPGDWIQVELYVPATGSFDATLAFQAHASEHSYTVSLWPDTGAPRTESVDFSFLGVGAG